MPPIKLDYNKVAVKGGGRCIYCGSDGPLGDEHVIPYSLGGNVELLNASCKRCEAITSYLDGYLANATFRHVRIQSGIQSRSGHPDRVPVYIGLRGTETVMDFPAKKHPSFLHMPVWRPPGIMRGVAPTSDFGDAKAHVYWYVPPDIRDTLNLGHGDLAQIIDKTPMPNITTFARAITKIAYCNAVLHHGLDGFRSLIIPDIILGKYPCIPHFVGCEMANPPPPVEEKALHIVNFGSIDYKRLGLLMVELRLFAQHGTEVLIGTKGKPSSILRRPLPPIPRVISL